MVLGGATLEREADRRSAWTLRWFWEKPRRKKLTEEAPGGPEWFREEPHLKEAGRRSFEELNCQGGAPQR